MLRACNYLRSVSTTICCSLIPAPHIKPIHPPMSNTPIMRYNVISWEYLILIPEVWEFLTFAVCHSNTRISDRDTRKKGHMFFKKALRVVLPLTTSDAAAEISAAHTCSRHGGVRGSAAGPVSVSFLGKDHNS